MTSRSERRRRGVGALLRSIRGAGTRWPVESLQAKIVLTTAAILALGGVIGGVALQIVERDERARDFEESAAALSVVVAAAVEHEHAEDLEHTQDMLARMASGPTGVEEVVLLGPDGRFVMAAWAGREALPADYAEDVALVLATRDVVIRRVDVNGEKRLRFLKPVGNQPECEECHGAGSPVLGVVAVAVDTGDLDRQVRQHSLLIAGFIAAGIVVVSVVFSARLRAVLGRRLARLVRATERVAEGDYSVRAEHTGNDEVARLARSFNDMAAALETRSRELEDLQRELENRVRSRTAQLAANERLRAELLQRLTSAQEDERARVARELHDEVGQALTSVAASCAVAAARLPDESTNERQLLRDVRSTATGALRDVRRITAHLRPEALDELGLPAALRGMARERLSEAGIEAVLDVPDAQRVLGRPAELALYRVAQEALNNVVRHAGARRVRVRLGATDGAVELEVSDDGRGFEANGVLESQLPREGWGLVGMRERLLPLGGTLEIDARPGRGTRLLARVPRPSGLGPATTGETV